MADVYIKTVSGGEDTTPSGTDAIELDDGTTSRWTLLSAVWQGAFNYIATLTAKTTLTGNDIIPLNDSAASNVGKGITWTNFMGQVAAFTSTLTNKRITKRVVTVTQAAEPAINTDNGDIFQITGLAQAITSLTTNLTGTPTDGQMMLMEITDNGTSRAITPGASFLGTAGLGIGALSTTISKAEMLLWKYSSALSVWQLVARDHAA